MLKFGQEYVDKGTQYYEDYSVTRSGPGSPK